MPHSGYITVVEPYQLLCYWSNFSKLLLAGWFKIWPQRYDFHSAKQPMIWNFEREKIKWQYHSQYKYHGLKLHNTLTYLVNMRVHLFLPIMENYSHGHFMLDTVLNGQGKTHSALEVIRLPPLLLARGFCFQFAEQHSQDRNPMQKAWI